MFNTATPQNANPPANFTAAVDCDGSLMGFWDGATIERPGYELQPSWSMENGLAVFIDHERDDPYTTEQVRDLIATLTALLEEHA